MLRDVLTAVHSHTWRGIVAGCQWRGAPRNGWVIPYQFTKVLHMTLSELDEIRCVGSPGGHKCPKGISSLLLVWLPPKWRIKYSTFCYFAVPVTIQSIITWAIFIILKNDLRHFEAERISFHLVYLTN